MQVLSKGYAVICDEGYPHTMRLLDTPEAALADHRRMQRWRGERELVEKSVLADTAYFEISIERHSQLGEERI